MTHVQASRTLLKSPPELWAECSDARSLARHLDHCFGEIRITRLEPEQTVAWEGERVSGTVKLEPAGWGTKVTLTAKAPEPKPPAGVAPEHVAAAGVAPERAAAAGVAPEHVAAARGAERMRMGFLGRLRQLLFAPQPAPPRPPPPEPSAPIVESGPPSAEVEAALGATLDSLGKAHHRPFSRA